MPHQPVRAAQAGPIKLGRTAGGQIRLGRGRPSADQASRSGWADQAGPSGQLDQDTASGAGGEWQRRVAAALPGLARPARGRHRVRTCPGAAVSAEGRSGAGLQRCGGAMAQGCDSPKQPFWVYLTELVAKKCLLFYVFATK